MLFLFESSSSHPTIKTREPSLVLVGSLVAVLLVLLFNKWYLTVRVGVSYLLLYMLFVIYVFVREYT